VNRGADHQFTNSPIPHFADYEQKLSRAHQPQRT
jgi:hypothetical protein